jgi:hypothetical protein
MLTSRIAKGKWDVAQCDGIAHFRTVAGGLLDAAMPLIGRGRSAAWAGRSGRGQDAAATKTQHCLILFGRMRRCALDLTFLGGRSVNRTAKGGQKHHAHI